MKYNARHRDIIGTLGFFCLGVLIGGAASAVAIWREWRQYKQSGVLEHNDVLRYVVVASVGAMIQLITLLVIILKHII